MFFGNSFKRLVNHPVSKDIQGSDRLLNVDFIGDGEFEINPFGFPYSDITLLNRAQSMQEYQHILARLQSYSSEQLSDSRSVANIIKSIKPWYVQTPSEVDAWATSIGLNISNEVKSILDKRAADELEKQLKDEASKVFEQSDNSVVQPAQAASPSAAAAS